MNIKIKQKHSLQKISLLLMGVLFFLYSPILGTNSPELNYFIGTWNCKTANTNSIVTIEEVNGGKWLSVKTEENDAIVLNEFWRVNGKHFERRIFTFDGSYLFVSGELPIQNGKIILMGSTGTKQSKKQVQNTIEIVSSSVFKTSWKKVDKTSKILSEETCEKTD